MKVRIIGLGEVSWLPGGDCFESEEKYLMEYLNAQKDVRLKQAGADPCREESALRMLFALFDERVEIIEAAEEALAELDNGVAY